MKVFLSHTASDEGVAKQLRAGLTSAGFTVWTADQLPAGTNIVYEIQRALAEADAAIFLISPDWNRSANATAELGIALARKANDPSFRVIPARVNSRTDIPAFLRRYRVLDLRENVAEPDRAMRQLVDSLQAPIEPPEPSELHEAEWRDIRARELRLRTMAELEVRREIVRERIVRILLLLTAFTSALGAVVAVWTQSAAIVGVVMAPLVGSLGAVLGFYFRGSEGRRD